VPWLGPDRSGARSVLGNIANVCGRFVSSNSPDEIAAYFGAVVDPDVPEPDVERENFNVAPTDDVLAVVADRGLHRAVKSYRWGLVPSWAKDVKAGAKMINARAETIGEKSVFKKLMHGKRLLVPMDGFYEWQVVPGEKVKRPMFVHRVDGEPLAVAGLWAAWRDPAVKDDDAAWLHSCTVITTSANGTMAPIHDRMPVILPESRWDEWLDPNNDDLESLLRLLVPIDDDVLTMHEVSTDVNSVRNNGPELVAPVS